MVDLISIRRRYEALREILDERSRRLVAAAESAAIGRGGISAVCRATGMSRQVIRQGMSELKEPGVRPPGRVRRPGGGRKKTVAQDTVLLDDLERLFEPDPCSDPEPALRWTSKSLRKLAEEMRQKGHQTSHVLVGRLMHDLGYRLHVRRQGLEGTDDLDRNAQFAYLNGHVKCQLQQHQPVIWVDTRRKELVEDPEREPGLANPSEIYDNSGWVSVGVDDDTAAFVVEGIRCWWRSMGQAAYPQATRLLIAADSGGRDRARARFWNVELQKLADETGLWIAVNHLPPGTSKWSKIEHRLVSFISQNWRGRPRVSHEVVVNLIAGTTTEAGLTVHSEPDAGTYPGNVPVSDSDAMELDLRRDKFHGDWNYTLHPRSH